MVLDFVWYTDCYTVELRLLLMLVVLIVSSEFAPAFAADAAVSIDVCVTVVNDSDFNADWRLR